MQPCWTEQLLDSWAFCSQLTFVGLAEPQSVSHSNKVPLDMFSEKVLGAWHNPKAAHLVNFLSPAIVIAYIILEEGPCTSYSFQKFPKTCKFTSQLL